MDIEGGKHTILGFLRSLAIKQISFIIPYRKTIFIFFRRGGIEMIRTNKRHTIIEAAEKIGVSTRTLLRWEKAEKIKKAKRDYRGRRIYDNDNINAIIDFYNALS